MRAAHVFLLVPMLLGLTGCEMVALHPAGDVALQERDLIVASTGLLLLIILPVMALTVFFAWRYRATNTAAAYSPEWHHSTGLEVAIWAGPLAIIIALGALTWISTHVLDPYRPVARIAPGRSAVGAEPLTVEVVAMDWKWLFIYPKLGIATVNELATPVNTPIAFKITSSTMMNAFFIPTLAGQIYAMPGMQTQMHAVINRPGVYEGFSSNYSGDGFSDMKFTYRGLDRSEFDRWVQSVRRQGGSLNRAAYWTLAKPSQHEPIRRFAHVDDDLFGAVVNACVAPRAPCISDVMRRDAVGGAARPMEAKMSPNPAVAPKTTPRAPARSSGVSQ